MTSRWRGLGIVLSRSGAFWEFCQDGSCMFDVWLIHINSLVIAAGFLRVSSLFFFPIFFFFFFEFLIMARCCWHGKNKMTPGRTISTIKIRGRLRSRLFVSVCCCWCFVLQCFWRNIKGNVSHNWVTLWSLCVDMDDWSSCYCHFIVKLQKYSFSSSMAEGSLINHLQYLNCRII